MSDPTETVEQETETEVDHSNQFVTFALANELFAVPMQPVQEIIRVPDVARMPLAPSSLDGLANLRGRVLPILSLRRLLGCAEQDHDDATRAIVINVGHALGFIVDRVASVISADASEIESSDSMDTIVRAEYLRGVIRRPRPSGGIDLMMIVDFDYLVQHEFLNNRLNSTNDSVSSRSDRIVDAAQEDAEDTDELRLVSFSVADQEYAIDIGAVQEIVQLPDHINHLPNVATHVLGIMTLRDRILPLVSLRMLFGMAVAAYDEHHRIVVVGLPDGAQVGLVTDSVKEVLSVPTSLTDAMPGVLAKDPSMQEFSSICRLDGGKRLVSIIATEQLLGLPALQEAAKLGHTSESMEEQEFAMATSIDEDESLGHDDDTQVVIFRLGEEEFGVPIMSVQEIVRVPESLTRVPKTPDFIEGVINLRGTVLPVIDQRRRLGMGTIDRNDRQRIMVYLLGGIRTGFIVDSVAEVLRIPRQNIVPAPSLSHEQSRLIRRVAKLENDRRLVMLIDPTQLLVDSDTQALQAALDPSASDPLKVAA